ncbi:MAG TPA: hypothetical protein VJ483_06860 [Holophagaceae bacterium]|nr:hypothetical protein [Holophagaceae bacterium]
MTFDTSQEPMETTPSDSRRPRPIDDILWELIAGDHAFLSILRPAKIHCTPMSTKFQLEDGRGVIVTRGARDLYSVAIGVPSGELWLALDAEPAVRGEHLATTIYRLLESHPSFE